MARSSFVVAVDAVIGSAEYDRPSVIRRSRPEWLIVSRWGLDGEHLTIAGTGVRDGTGGGVAPLGLAPRWTMLGLLLSSDDSADDAAMFLLARRLLPETAVAGVFFPTDGYARLSQPDAALHLHASGRYAHSRGKQAGQTVRGDVPDPPASARGAAAWSIDGIRRPWDGEFI